MIRSPQFTSGLMAAVLAVCGVAASTGAVAADAVTVQLKWLPQAQFAGYYVAQAREIIDLSITSQKDVLETLQSRATPAHEGAV